MLALGRCKLSRGYLIIVPIGSNWLLVPSKSLLVLGKIGQRVDGIIKGIVKGIVKGVAKGIVEGINVGVVALGCIWRTTSGDRIGYRRPTCAADTGAAMSILPTRAMTVTTCAMEHGKVMAVSQPYVMVGPVPCLFKAISNVLLECNQHPPLSTRVNRPVFTDRAMQALRAYVSRASSIGWIAFYEISNPDFSVRITCDTDSD